MLPQADPPDQMPVARTSAARLFRWFAPPADPAAQPALGGTRSSGLLRALTSPAARCLALALVMTGLLTALGVVILDEYHTRAHYHFDSAGYRYNALLLQQTSRGGRWAAAGALLQQKDTLDVVVRLLVYRKSLSYFHGHLFVQVPFMAMFFFLALWYVYRRTGTYLYGVAGLSTAFLFGTVYHPVQGLMDYWKDNIAVWLLGGALLSWFLSERGTRRGWAFLCGLLLSLLALQRVVIVVYGAAIILPYLTLAVVQRVRDGSWRKFLGDALAFGVVPFVVAGFILVTQAKGIVQYYAVAGYAYDTPAAIAKFLWTHPFSTPTAFRLGLLAFLVIPVLALATGGWRRVGDVLAGLWPLVAFPALVIATKAQYHSYSVVLLVLAVVAVCRLVPQHLSALSLQRLSVALIAVAAVGGVVQARYYAAQTEQYAQRNAQYRELYRELGDVLATKPPGSGVGFFFDECYALVQMQLSYDRGVRPNPHQVIYFSSVHPSYYRMSFGDKPPAEIAAFILAQMEQDVGMVAVVPTQIENFARLVGPDPAGGEPVPVQVNGRITRHIQASPRWRAIRYLASDVYGPLMVFQLSPTPLSPEEKWGALSFHTPVTGINFATAVAPGVRQMSYSTPPACPSEWYNGVAYQWVMAGERGVSVSVLADRPTEVILRAGIIPGPSRSGTRRTVVVRHAGAEQRVEFADEGELKVPLRLRTGLNVIEIRSADQGNMPPVTADTRQLMFQLRSPHLLPASDPEPAK